MAKIELKKYYLSFMDKIVIGLKVILKYLFLIFFMKSEKCLNYYYNLYLLKFLDVVYLLLVKFNHFTNLQHCYPIIDY